jgi:hypothetical protein
VTENGSGLASDGAGKEALTPAATASGVGTWTYSVTNVKDKAGNPSAAASATYQVVYGGAFSGVLQPINPDRTSRFKAGRTISVKFQLLCNGQSFSMARARIQLIQTSGTVTGAVPEEEISTSASPGTDFRYDSSAQQYVFNMGTTKTIQGTFKVQITLDSGEVFESPEFSIGP